jgi:phosphatidate cytidylyltransferase
VVAAFAVAARGARVEAAVRWVAAGMVYAGIAIVSLIELRKGADGFGAVVFVLLVAWATDTAAFLVGRQIGGPRLWRRVSPSKTWSGALGGLAAGTAFGALVAVALDVPPSLSVVLAAALVAVAAEAGDLLESACKRRFHIKDAGTIIPGHGGVMDRVDGLVAASVATLVLGSLTGGGTASAGLLALMGR